MESELLSHPNFNGYMSNGGNDAISTPSQQNGVNESSAQQLHWNPRHLEIKTRSVEKTLEPLVMQVTTLVSSKSPQKKKGKSKVQLLGQFCFGGGTARGYVVRVCPLNSSLLHRCL